MQYGYVRVSTSEQNTARQEAAMKQIGVEKVFLDKASGKDFKREQYQAMIDVLQEGDVVFVTSLDRLGRNYKEIAEQWDVITKKKKADMVVMDMDVLDTRRRNDLTGTLISDIVVKLLSYVAEKERESIRERQTEGIAAMPVVNGKRVSAKTGRGFGRPKIEVNQDILCHLISSQKAGKITVNECCKQLGIGRTTWYELAGRAMV